MGVLNVTPDSFSDGGKELDADRTLVSALRMADEGADFIDLGAESTRPGAEPVTLSDEWRRLEPVFERLAKRKIGARLSIDTRKSAIMLKAAACGIDLINDSSGKADGQPAIDPDNAGANDETLVTLAGHPGLQYSAMHLYGTPKTMQLNPLRGDGAVTSVEAFFQAAYTRLMTAGFTKDRLWFDPGIGFGKDDSGNLAVLAQIPKWSQSLPIAIGVSRKGFIGRILDIPQPQHRDAASKMLELGLAIAGVGLIRTHDVQRLARLRNTLAGGC